DAFVQDSFQLTRNTTVQVGLRYEYMSPLTDIRYANTNLVFQNGRPFVFVGGQLGYPKGLLYSNELNFAPRFGVSQNVPRLGLVLHGAFGIFYTPVDMNTWCNQRHNVPYVFPETQQSDNFTPAAGIVATHFDFGQPVLGRTTVSFAAFDPHAPPQYIEQWSLSVAKSLGDAPDFRSPMFESAIPQNNGDLSLEKGPACDIRHRFALSAVYDLPALGGKGLLSALTRDWHLSAVFQAQSGFPLTISVFGDTANAGTLLGENPVRANYTGQPIFNSGTRTSDRWFNPAAFSTPAAFTFGSVGRNTVYG